MRKAKESEDNLEDVYQDICLWFLTYDNEKLMNAHNNNHMNALITAVLQHQIYSKNSYYYRDYKKFAEHSDEITSEILNLPDGEL